MDMDQDCEARLRELLNLVEANQAADEEQAENREILNELHRGRAEAFAEVAGLIRVLLPS
jgi:hypothetical protein